ncbi:hypothetical protein [Pseudenhygromyxa sp. WMMC2535]|nr:hypothetical protein [Pseudenhygromyxa sp. WMMC2535]
MTARRGRDQIGRGFTKLQECRLGTSSERPRVEPAPSTEGTRA